MILVVMAPDNAMVAGIDRSTLPGPVVMTNICPMPTMMVKVANDNAAVSICPPPWPPVNRIVAIHTIAVATKDQIQARVRR